MSTWGWVVLVFFWCCLACLALFWAAGRVGNRHDAYDSMVDVVSDDEPIPGCDCEDCWLETLTEPHRSDCACDTCFAKYPTWVAALRARFEADQQAAANWDKKGARP